MAITFAPKRGAILMCDFDMACVPPEMRKVRQVVVFSVDSLNHRRGAYAGTSVVVPFSTVMPQTDGPEEIHFPVGLYWSLPKESWARCKMVATVSHDRLDLFLRGGSRRRSEFMRAVDISRIEMGVKAALGIA